MAVREIVIAPDPRLKTEAEPVAGVDAGVRRLMDDLVETMHSADGIGLAAPQIGVLERVIVVAAPRGDADDDGEGRSRKPLRMANPEVVWESDEMACREEGCLSLPEHYAEVVRPKRVRVRYLGADGTEQEIEAEGLLGACIQHEMDHLDGVLFVDHISSLKRSIILRKLTKAKKQNGAAA